MKKVISILLTLMMFCMSGLAFADDAATTTDTAATDAMGESVVANDLSKFSDDDLRAALSAIRNELTRRSLVTDEKTVIFDQDGIQVYLTGEYEVWGSDTKYITFNAVVINDSESKIGVSLDDVSINGWNVYGSGIYDTAASKKQKSSIEFNLTDAEISSFEEIEDIEFVVSVYDSDSYDTIATSDVVTLNFNGAEAAE